MVLLIYTHKITPRFTYITKQFFSGILGLEIQCTTRVEDFIKHTGPKLTYTRKPLQNEFFIQSNELLFETGINELEVLPGVWDDVPCFFRNTDESTIPYDILAASFYLISRYEEYLPHVKDMHGRFSPLESLAYQQEFLQLPLIDIWAYKLHGLLKERFPELAGINRKYNFLSLIDVTSSHCYARRGVVRSTSGFLLDLFRFKFKRVAGRIKVWFNPASDPYDNYDTLIELHQKYGVKSMFFFQFAAYSTYDKNVSPDNNKFQALIKSVADYSIVSLAASYSSAYNAAILKSEKKRLSNVINRPLKYVRMRYNRVDIPHTYRHLAEAEFTEDFTMGYTHEIGFRASTCTPFFFYDIAQERQQPIRVNPFAFHDYALLKFHSIEDITAKIEQLYQAVSAVDGRLVSVFSNELLGGDEEIDWLKLYENYLDLFHE